VTRFRVEAEFAIPVYAASDDDVVFYSRRYGPDEWAVLMADVEADPRASLVFTLATPSDGVPR